MDGPQSRPVCNLQLPTRKKPVSQRFQCENRKQGLTQCRCAQCCLSLRESALAKQLDISFGRIDGSGGTLAQAYFPADVNSARIAGDVQFDSSENWEIGNAKGSSAFDLVRVAVHEIGHALGLDHNRLPVPSARAI